MSVPRGTSTSGSFILDMNANASHLVPPSATAAAKREAEEKSKGEWACHGCRRFRTFNLHECERGDEMYVMYVGESACSCPCWKDD